ncbi:cation diffusion facilitator family transporter [Stakelama marina]|uniref:Cation transporter n=1 Tax=Stakelama marina TaxID=2826939 RepID=A0A8T4IEZ3_9SPHN|nr:cation diffusion facilitator family transporter [Stakelama marina]MBR0552424.1 cation transporter [Stakelama marina]
MADCGCEPPPLDTLEQHRALKVALWLNAAMFVVEVSAGLFAHSTGLLADGLDMLSDAFVYAIALLAISRSARFKANAAGWSGIMLLILGIGLLIEVIRRAANGTSPEAGWMLGVAAVALIVNIVVLRLLSRQRASGDEVHLRAAWIFTRADVVANAAVIASALAILATGLRYFDLIVGAAIGAYVIREAFEIMKDARDAKASLA